MLISNCLYNIEANIARAAIANSFAPLNDADSCIHHLIAKIIEIADYIFTAISSSYCQIKAHLLYQISFLQDDEKLDAATIDQLIFQFSPFEDQEDICHQLMEKVDAQDHAGFQLLFRQLSPEEAAPIAYQLLLDRVDELNQPIANRDRYEFIVKNLKMIFPFCTSYFTRNKKPKTGPHFDILTPKALRLMIAILEKKGSLNGVQFKACDNFDSFGLKLRDAFAHLENNSSICFLLRHRHLNQPKVLQNHQTMIFLEKRDGHFRCFACDSKGREDNWTKRVAAFIQKEVQQAELDDQFRLCIYNGKKRQRDSSNCPVYVLRDGVHMAQDPSHFMDWIEERAEFCEETRVFQLEHLPPRMMETTQSLTLVEEYLEETQSRDALIYSRSKPMGKTLNQAMDKHIAVSHDDKGVPKRINAKVANLFLKYERLIFANAILLGC